MLRGTQYLACGRNLSSINIWHPHKKRLPNALVEGVGVGGGALDSFDKFTYLLYIMTNMINAEELRL